LTVFATQQLSRLMRVAFVNLSRVSRKDRAMSERNRAEHEPDTKMPVENHPFLSMWLHPIDRYLRQRLAIFEYTQVADCMFRIEIVANMEDVLLVDGTRLRVGDRLIELHFWNEHIPVMPKEGATVAWARHICRCFDSSMRELAAFLSSRRDLDDIRGLRANMTTGAQKQTEQLVRIVQRYGFEWIPSPGSETLAQRTHRFGENILVSALIRAHNPRAAQKGTLKRGRIPLYLSRHTLERYYGKSAKQPHTNPQSVKAPKPLIPRSKAGS